jgi:hypothetical protein
LYELGASSSQNTRVDAGQNYHMIDGHIAGNFLGMKADIADGSLRRWEFRSFANIVGKWGCRNWALCMPDSNYPE